MKWFRIHHSLFDDNTYFKRLTDIERYRYLHLYFLASKTKERTGELILDDEGIAFELRCEEEDWMILKAKFKAKGLIDFIPFGVSICSWSEDQYTSDSSTERVRKHRKEKTKRSSNADETFHDAPVTPMKHHETPSYTDPESYPDPDPDSKFKDSLSHKGSLSQEPEREREVAQAPRSQEPEQSSKRQGVTEPEKSEVKSKLVLTNRISGEGDYSAASPPKDFEITAWANFTGPGNHPVFWASVVNKAGKLPNCVDAESSAESWIRKSGHLLWARFQEEQQPRPAPLVPAKIQPLATQDPRAALVGLRRDLGDAIAAIQVHLGALNWSNQDAARYMQAVNKWTCERGATKNLLDGRGSGFMMLGDDELIELHDEILKLKPGQCIPTPEFQMAS
jgi:hypothetical protein